MALQWDDAMTTGVADVDDAHRTLILWINKLSDAMRSGQAKPEVLRILTFLGDYAHKHFSSEESCMHRLKCPTAQANRHAHAEFLQYFGAMKAEVEAKGVTSVTVIELQAALGNWLRNHIMKVDTALLACVGTH